MSLVARCRCGEKYAIAAMSFPRRIACHSCGSRCIVLGPDAIDGDGWRLAEEIAAIEPAPPASVACSVCRRPAFAACSVCGMFYCPRHGRARTNGRSTCVRCYDQQRPVFFVVGISLIVFAVLLTCMPFWGPWAPGPNDAKFPYFAVSLPPSAGFLLSGLILVWQSRRSFP